MTGVSADSAPERMDSFQRSDDVVQQQEKTRPTSAPTYGHVEADKTLNGLSAKLKKVKGHAGLLSHPAYDKLVSLEPWLKRIIPALIVSSLAIIGFARIVQVLENRDVLIEHGKENLELVANLVEYELSDLPEKIETGQRENVFNAALSAALPDGATRDGRVLLLTDPQGQIFAEAPLTGDHRGTYLSDILLQTQAMMTFGKQAGVMEVGMVATGETTLATVRILPNGHGALAVFQTKSSLLNEWRKDISLNASIFIATSVLMIIVLYGYFSQATRADEADKIYQETYSRFDTALMHGKCGLWDWDIARARLFWSPSMYEILGMAPRENLIGFSEVDALIHPDDLDLFKVAQAMLASGEKAVDHLFRMRHAEGHWVWMRSRGEHVINKATGAPHLVGICIDVTEQKQLEEETKNANERLRDSIESFSEAFVLWDANNNLIMCNEPYRRMHGFTAEMIKPGNAYSDLSQLTGTALHQIAHTDLSISQATHEVQTHDNRWVQIDERRTSDGGFVSIGTDITTIKQQQAALETHEKELENTILSLQASQSDLRRMANQFAEQRKIAEEANFAKAQFLANISHEWRTPLNAIIGFSEVMKDEAFGPLGSEKYQEYCGDIHESGAYMLSFINDILSMSQIEEGTYTLEHESISLANMIEETVEALGNETEKHEVEVNVTNECPAPLMADRRAIKLTLRNLISNAIKFSQSGGEVEVRCHQCSQYTSVEVVDHGIGIPESALKKLGRPFEQVQNQFTKDHKGSGLGLAISRSLVEMHSGQLFITSKLGHGTKVTLRIPRPSQEELSA